MRPIVPTGFIPDNPDLVSPGGSWRDRFTTTGAPLPHPRYISRPDKGLVRLYGAPDPLGYCRDTGFSWLNTETGEVVPQRCRRNTCLHSARHEVERLTAALVLAAPEVLVRYSSIPLTWPEAQKKINRVHQYLRREDRRFKYAYAIEHNPAGTGCHVHGLMYGDPVDDILGIALEKAGLGDHHLQEVTHAGRLGYLMKQAQHSQRSLDSFLLVNGGTLLHTSQGFWRDGPGGAALTRREAMKVGWRRLHPPDPRWARVATTPEAGRAWTPIDAHRPGSGSGTSMPADSTPRRAA